MIHLWSINLAPVRNQRRPKGAQASTSEGRGGRGCRPAQPSYLHTSSAPHRLPWNLVSPSSPSESSLSHIPVYRALPTSKLSLNPSLLSVLLLQPTLSHPIYPLSTRNYNSNPILLIPVLDRLFNPPIFHRARRSRCPSAYSRQSIAKAIPGSRATQSGPP